MCDAPECWPHSVQERLTELVHRMRWKYPFDDSFCASDLVSRVALLLATYEDRFETACRHGVKPERFRRDSHLYSHFNDREPPLYKGFWSVGYYVGQCPQALRPFWRKHDRDREVVNAVCNGDIERIMTALVHNRLVSKRVLAPTRRGRRSTRGQGRKTTGPDGMPSTRTNARVEYYLTELPRVDGETLVSCSPWDKRVPAGCKRSEAWCRVSSVTREAQLPHQAHGKVGNRDRVTGDPHGDGDPQPKPTRLCRSKGALFGDSASRYRAPGTRQQVTASKTKTRNWEAVSSKLGTSLPGRNSPLTVKCERKQAYRIPRSATERLEWGCQRCQRLWRAPNVSKCQDCQRSTKPGPQSSTTGHKNQRSVTMRLQSITCPLTRTEDISPNIDRSLQKVPSERPGSTKSWQRRPSGKRSFVPAKFDREKTYRNRGVRYIRWERLGPPRSVTMRLRVGGHTERPRGTTSLRASANSRISAESDCSSPTNGIPCLGDTPDAGLQSPQSTVTPAPHTGNEDNGVGRTLRIDAGTPERDHRVQAYFPNTAPRFPGTFRTGEKFWDDYDPEVILDEPIIVSRSGESGFGIVSGRGVHRPFDVRPLRNTGTLARVSSHRVDLQVVRALDPTNADLQQLINVITVESEFKKLVSESELRNGRVSRFMQHHVHTLTEANIAFTVPEGIAVIEMPLFTVLKKDGTLRLIADCRKLNTAMSRPPTMKLPRLHDFIDTVLAASFAAQADGVSYFYQIPLHESIQKYFGSRISGARGQLEHVLLRCLPMGWSWAPAIAQEISNTLVRDVGIAWVDNFVVLGSTAKDFHDHRQEFLDRIDRANVELDDRTLEPHSTIEVVGLEFDLTRKLYRMSPKWITKAAQRLADVCEKQDVTAADVYRIAGTIIWMRYALKKSLCRYTETLAAMGKIGRDIASGKISWNSGVGLTVNHRAELKGFAAELGNNEWRTARHASEPSVEIYSDASGVFQAYLLLEDNVLIFAHVREADDPEQHIFLKELYAALLAIQAAVTRGHRSLRLFIDNQPAALVLQRGASTNYLANRMMADMLHPEVYVEVNWIPTTSMLADPYTRGWPLPPIGVSRAQLLKELEAFHALA